MKKTKTTYGVLNLVEWHARLKMGKAALKVSFTGGAITTQGVTPATFTTSDPVAQFIIENCAEFKAGKIKIIRRINLGGEVEICRNEARKDSEGLEQSESSKAEGVIENNQDLSGEVVQTGEQENAEEPKILEESETSEESKSENDKQSESSEISEQSEKSNSTEVAEEKALIEVEFACNDDAKDYLEQKFGCVRSKLHNRAAIVAAGKANGVNIIFS